MIGKYAVTFNGDGTYASTPTPLTIIPGTTFSVQGQILNDMVGSDSELDLSVLSLAMTIVDNTGTIKLYRSGSPTFVIVNALVGEVNITLDAGTTKYLTQGTYTLEIKAYDPIGNKYQICYAPIAVGFSALSAL